MDGNEDRPATSSGLLFAVTDIVDVTSSRSCGNSPPSSRPPAFFRSGIRNSIEDMPRPSSLICLYRSPIKCASSTRCRTPM
jgi:hypothetical protein